MDSPTLIFDRSLLRQVVAISPILIYAVSQVMLYYMPSLALDHMWKREPKLYERGDGRNLYRIVTVADVVGSIISAILMKYIGRRTTHRIFTAVGMIAFLTIWFAPNKLTLKAGSTFTGLSIGGSNSLGSIMIGEYASPKYRGVFLYLKNFIFLIGGMTTVLIKTLVSLPTAAMIGLVPLVISFAIIQVTPETPMWLASRKKYKDSEKVFYELRGEDSESTKEIREVIQTQEALHSTEATEKSLSKHIIRFLSKFISLELLKPFGIIVIAIIVLEFSGRNYLTTNPVAIANRFVDDDSFDINLIYILMSVSALISVILIKHCRQRVLLFSTGCLACFIMVLVLFLSAIIPVSRPAIIDTVLSMYCLLTNICCSPLPLVLVGELFPLEHKGVGAVAAGVMSQTLRYAVGMLSYYILVQYSFNIRWMLLIYTAVTSACLLILYYILPETKDLTLQDIEKNFVKRSETYQQGVELGSVDQ